MIRSNLFLLIFSLLLISCSSDPKTYKITDANKDKVVEEIKEMRGLTIEESRLLFTYLMRINMADALSQNKTNIVGKTVGDLISEQREFETSAKKREDESAKLAAEAKAKEEALSAELRKSINLAVYDKSFTPSNPSDGEYESYIVLRCTYRNTSGKDIRAFKGKILFTDLFDKQIFESGITIDDPIRAGATAKWTGTIKYNQFVDAHSALKNAELKNMKVVWNPISAIFTDGTQIGGTQ